jgi:hypothetical protein
MKLDFNLALGDIFHYCDFVLIFRDSWFFSSNSYFQFRLVLSQYSNNQLIEVILSGIDRVASGLLWEGAFSSVPIMQKQVACPVMKLLVFWRKIKYSLRRERLW